MTIFDYSKDDAIGSVFAVDTGTVMVTVADTTALRQMQVNQLVALTSARAGQHLVGLVTKIMRRALVATSDDENGAEPEPTVVENIVKITLIGTLLDKVGAESNVFRRTLETVPEIDADCFVLGGERLTRFMQAINKKIAAGKEPLNLGHYTLDGDATAWIDGNRFFQRHAVVVGSTGSGKSWTVARIVEQVAALPNASALLFDIHGEYAPLKHEGIEHLRVAGPSDFSSGLSLDDGVLHLPYWLLSYEEMLALLLDRSDQNAPNQAMVFNRQVTMAKRTYLEEHNQPEVLAHFTIDSPIPYDLTQVIADLNDQNEEMVDGASGRAKQGPFHGKLSRFIQRLQAKSEDRRLGFMFAGSEETQEYSWLERLATMLLGSTGTKTKGGIKVIDFSEVPSDVLPLVIGLVARLVFSIQQWTPRDSRHPIAILCDEAHLYIPERSATGILEQSLTAFERIAKEGRKYGVGLTVISQRPSEVNRTVLSQCSNFVSMRLTNAEDQSVIRRLLPDTLGGFADLLPILDVGEALVVGDAAILPSRIRISPPKSKPDSATIEFWDRWADDDVAQNMEVAVESLRRQST